MIVPIDDPLDDRISAYRHLNRVNLTRPSGLFIAEGRWLVLRLLRSRLTTRSVLASERYCEEMVEVVPHAIPIYSVPHKMVDEIIGFKFHRGILACGERPSNITLPELVRYSDAGRPDRQTIVACPDVVDPTNLGGIIRNVAAFGASGMFVGTQGGDPYSRRAIRVSMGTAFQIPIGVSSSVEEDLKRLKDDYGFEIVATVLDSAAERLERAQRSSRTVLLFGGEGHGLSERILQSATRRITLPMRLETDSLNVAASSAVFLYHFTRMLD